MEIFSGDSVYTKGEEFYPQSPERVEPVLDRKSSYDYQLVSMVNSTQYRQCAKFVNSVLSPFSISSLNKCSNR